jgi:hypothetical protein
MVLWKWKMSKKFRLRLHNIYYISILTHKAETLKWTKEDVTAED